jgi:hypothetical protein
VATQASRRIGRPTKLTPEVQDRIIAAISAGCTAKHAARVAGIHRMTMFRWLREARKPGARADLRGFAEAFACACAERKRKRVAWELIMDGQSRVIGRRITRHLPNGVTEVTDQFTRRDRRVLKAQVRAAGRTGRGPFEALFGAGAP